MTIHHFYLVAGCLLWLYLLCCLCIKLMLAVRRRRHHDHQKQQIDWFLTSGHSRKYRRQHHSILGSCLNDDILFDYLFTRYVQLKPRFQPEELTALCAYLEKLMHQKIKLLPADAPIQRELLIYHCIHSELSTPVIRQFLRSGDNLEKARAIAQAGGIRAAILEESEVPAWKL